MSETRYSRSFPPHSPDFGGGMPILFFCCLLALSAPFISFLIYNNYGVIRFELAGIFLLFLALSLIFSTVSLFRKRALNIIAYGFVVVVFCDLAFAEFIKQDSLLQSLGLLFGLFCVAALVARFLSKACWQALAAFLLVYLTTTILAPETRPSAILPAVPVSSKDETGPRPVIHLILGRTPWARRYSVRSAGKRRDPGGDTVLLPALGLSGLRAGLQRRVRNQVLASESFCRPIGSRAAKS